MEDTNHEKYTADYNKKQGIRKIMADTVKNNMKMKKRKETKGD